MSKYSVYLCGSMSDQKNYGREWRKRENIWLANRGISCFNPCTEEKRWTGEFDLPKNFPLHKWNRLPQPLQEKIIRADLRQVKYKTWFVLVYFTRYSTGTISEITTAFDYDVPVYFVTRRKLRGWPGTVAGKEGNRVFRTFEELHNFLSVKYRLKKIKL